MKVYITKYALKEGIVEGTLLGWWPNKKVAQVELPTGVPVNMYPGKDFFYTLEQAQTHAEGLRTNDTKRIGEVIQLVKDEYKPAA